jgi:hypothetical protein
MLTLEVVSKPQIRFKGKAQADRESAAYIGYVSIYRRPATQPLGLRWGFETTSKPNGNRPLAIHSAKERNESEHTKFQPRND